MSSRKLWAMALASLVGIAVVGTAGCADQTQEDDSGTSNDELSLRRGSVDHAAIVEVTTVMLASIAEDPVDFATVLDPYNEDDPFAIHGGNYSEQFGRNLKKLDNADGHADWTPAQSASWVSRVANGNYQIIDTSKPCDWQNPHTYLEIERAQLTGHPHTTCGGRMPNEDALDVTLNFLIRGPAASALDADAVTDGVDEATKPATDEFPYLADMN